MRRESERGAALVMALMAMLILVAVGAALALNTSVEALISSNFRGGLQALYAAEAAAEWAVPDLLAAAPDWPTLLDQSIVSPFVDGPPTGTRVLPDGTVVDLGAVVASNPTWRAYAFGALRDLMPPSNQPTAFYVVVLVAADAGSAARLNLRVEAFGPRGAHKVLLLNVSRSSAGAKFESWREAR